MLQIFPEADVDPRLIAANTLLQLSSIELEQAIVQELNDNPALEKVEHMLCATCGSTLYSGLCAHCTGITLPEMKSFLYPGSLSSSSALDETSIRTDPFGAIAAPQTLAEHLFAQLRLILDRRDHEIALYIVGNIDERGYLLVSVEKIAQAMHTDIGRVDRVLQEIQSLEPVGIGARNVIECLLIQLKRLSREHISIPSATEAIIRYHLTELGHHQFERIRTILHVTRAEVEAAFLFIRTNLHPYPAHHYSVVPESDTFAQVPLVPSALIYRHADSSEYDVEIIESVHGFLRLNPVYQNAARYSERACSQREREHVQLFLERAKLFRHQLQRRSHLLRKVMLYVIEYQRDFLDQGVLHLRPLTQKAVAEQLNIHVSLVSRTIAGKFALLPSQRLIPLHLFFSGEALVQERIRKLIDSESEPLSDARISQILKAEQNITLSRQMVANYRSGLGIPAARQRAVLYRKETV